MNRLNRRKGVAFGAAERRKAQHGELRLQLANIVAAESKVVRKIAGAAAMSIVDSKSFLNEGTFEAEHIVTNRRKFARKLLQQGLIQDGHEGGGKKPPKKSEQEIIRRSTCWCSGYWLHLRNR